MQKQVRDVYPVQLKTRQLPHGQILSVLIGDPKCVDPILPLNTDVPAFSSISFELFALDIYIMVPYYHNLVIFLIIYKKFHNQLLLVIDITLSKHVLSNSISRILCFSTIREFYSILSCVKDRI